MCGIVSGHITKWNNPILTATNGGVLGTGNITFVHRHGRQRHHLPVLERAGRPVPLRVRPDERDQRDRRLLRVPVDGSRRLPARQPLLPVGANQLNWPDQFPTDQCGGANSNPGGGTFADASGSGSLVALVTSTNGAIGYASSDFWLPVRVGGLKTANLQSEWDLTVGTGQFQPPSWQAAQTAMASAVPSFATAADRANPLAWSLQGVVPNPILPGSYPIVGFSWINMYQCYQVHANGINAFNWLTTWINYLYGSPNAYAILHENGFAEVPSAWNVAAYTLLTDSTYGPKFTGTGSCAGKVGAY